MLSQKGFNLFSEETVILVGDCSELIRTEHVLPSLFLSRIMENTGKVEIVTLIPGFQAVSGSFWWSQQNPQVLLGISSKCLLNHRDWSGKLSASVSVNGEEGHSITVFISILPSLVIFIRIDCTNIMLCLLRRNSDEQFPRVVNQKNVI